MVTVTIKRCGGSIASFAASGHAYSGEAGHDVVCAAVSAILQTAILGLKDHLKVPMGYSMQEGEDNELFAVVDRTLADEQRNNADIVLETMRLGLLSAALSAPEHLRIVETEV